jgi:MtrB/PioB family decaheme-associated outer membrane protein
VGYTRGNWQARLGYYGSFFSDGHGYYDWVNAFTPLNAGATGGQMSLPPNSSFNQLALTGSWQILPTLRLMGSFAYGRELQNAGYMPSTINPLLATAPLPANSLSGEVNVGIYVIRLNATPAKHLFANLEFLEDRRDNNTSQYAYQQVVTDTFVGSNQVNVPYSFDRFDTKINAGYRILPNWQYVSQIKLQIGGDYLRYDRTFQEVLRNHTDTVWGEFDANLAYGIAAMVKYTYARRLLDEYEIVPGLTPPQNPLMMQYNTADRARDQWMATLSFNPIPKVGLDFIWLEDDDRYDNTVIGLTRDNEYSYTVNLNWNPKERITFNAYYTHEVIWTSQAGSQSFSVPDWNGSNNVQIDTVGVGLQWKDALPRLDFGLDFDWAYSNQATTVSTGLSGVPGFPENSNRDLIAKLWTRYQLNTRWSLRFDYEYAKENTADWALSGVDPATISNVLALGVIAPNYDVNLFRLRAQYTF